MMSPELSALSPLRILTMKSAPTPINPRLRQPLPRMLRFPSRKNVTLRWSPCAILLKLAMDMVMAMATVMAMEMDMEMVTEKDMERAINTSANRLNRRLAEMYQ